MYKCWYGCRSRLWWQWYTVDVAAGIVVLVGGLLPLWFSILCRAMQRHIQYLVPGHAEVYSEFCTGTCRGKFRISFGVLPLWFQYFVHAEAYLVSCAGLCRGIFRISGGVLPLWFQHAEVYLVSCAGPCRGIFRISSGVLPLWFQYHMPGYAEAYSVFLKREKLSSTIPKFSSPPNFISRTSKINACHPLL